MSNSTPEASSDRSARRNTRLNSGRNANQDSGQNWGRNPRANSADSQRTDRGQRGHVDAARGVAFDVLVAVDKDDAYANLILPGMLSRAKLQPRDAGFATELTYSTLRYRGQLDAIIERAASRAVSDIDVHSLNALRLGACQLLHLRTPAHAAVSTSVDLARRHRQSAAGFVNAVLRSIQDQTLDQWLDALGTSLDADSDISVRFSHPRWMVSSLRDALISAGRAADELQPLLAADNAAARPMLVARPGASTVAELRSDDASKVESASQPTRQQNLGAWSPYAVEAPAGDPGRLEAVRSGRAAVQDEGSQLVALLAAAVAIDGRDELWLDGCAGPGGKTGLLAALAGMRSAHIDAMDVSRHRSELVAATCRPFTNVSVRTGDVVAVADADWFPAGGFDRILVDVPCTGMGALRRRPELRWRRSPRDVGSLVGLQENILRSALAAVRVGGVVVYSTCSPHVLETSAVVSKVCSSLSATGIISRVIDAREVVAAGSVARDPAALVQTQHDSYLRLWPHVHGTDAMFAAAIMRDA